MSHWTRIRARIANPDPNLLRKAIEVVAEQLKQQLCADLMDLREMPGGYNIFGYRIRITSQGVIVEGDDMWVPSPKEVADMLLQNYIAIALATLAPQLGFQVQNVAQMEGGGVLIDLVR